MKKRGKRKYLEKKIARIKSILKRHRGVITKIKARKFPGFISDYSI